MDCPLMQVHIAMGPRWQVSPSISVTWSMSNRFKVSAYRCPNDIDGYFVCDLHVLRPENWRVS